MKAKAKQNTNKQTRTFEAHAEVLESKIYNDIMTMTILPHLFPLICETASDCFGPRIVSKGEDYIGLHLYFLNGSQLAKMKKSIPDMSLP